MKKHIFPLFLSLTFALFAAQVFSSQHPSTGAPQVGDKGIGVISNNGGTDRGNGLIANNGGGSGTDKGNGITPATDGVDKGNGIKGVDRGNGIA